MLLALALLLTAFSGCGRKEDTDAVVLRIANWEEYIDEGGWDEDECIELGDGTRIMGENSMVKDFEEWYYETYHKKVVVEYSTFGTNEDLYNQLTIGDTFDLVCPSEYMIMKLMTEDKVLPYSEEFQDPDLETNYYIKGVSPYIKDRVDGLEINGQKLSDMAACYMWGVVGYVYNPEIISREEASDWNLLRNPDYYKRVTTKDSVRDSYFAALGMLYQDEISGEDFRKQDDYAKKLDEMMNDTSQDTVDQVQDLLTQVKDNVYSFETDSGKADLVTGKVAANLQWSGDAVYSMEQAKEDGVELSFAVPDPCTNRWFDGWCMLKDGIDGDKEKQQAADAFVNFVSRPDNAVRNSYYIGYTSSIAGGDSDIVYQYVKWNYEAEEETDEELCDYPLGYFFGEDSDDPQYILKTELSQTESMLFAQYPTEDVLDRSVVMAYFNGDANERINRMWINVRCFKLGK